MASTGTTTFVLVVALLAVAVAMAFVARWLMRSTRRDTPALAPLEAMGDRSWRRGDKSGRELLLAHARPDGARGPAPVLDYEAEPEPEPEADPAAEIEVEVLHRYSPDDG